MSDIRIAAKIKRLLVCGTVRTRTASQAGGRGANRPGGGTFPERDSDRFELGEPRGKTWPLILGENNDLTSSGERA